MKKLEESILKEENNIRQMIEKLRELIVENNLEYKYEDSLKKVNKTIFKFS